MKPAPFAYVRPATLGDAVDELAATGGDGKVLAGGQSLVPVMALRLGRPSTLVDISGLRSLATIERESSRDGGVLRIGAATCQRQVEHAAEASAVPLLGMALPFVGHRELRSRGTVCGSLAHADPSAELPAVACCLGATLHLTGPAGRRDVATAEFFRGAMTTAVAADEILEAVSFPVARDGEGYGFAELARRHGDFALAGVVTRVRSSADGDIQEAVVSGFGVSDRPVTRDVTPLVRAAAGSDAVESALRGMTTTLATDVVDTAGDAHGSQAYRRRLFSVLAARELARAYRGSLGAAA
ncbi:MAG: FAD binding domain-containing protein [Streptosporangiaceae bacterium]|jgi:carbon-monoxide dehydrogenase medium subunit